MPLYFLPFKITFLLSCCYPEVLCTFFVVYWIRSILFRTVFALSWTFVNITFLYAHYSFDRRRPLKMLIWLQLLTVLKSSSKTFWQSWKNSKQEMLTTSLIQVGYQYLFVITWLYSKLCPIRVKWMVRYYYTNKQWFVKPYLSFVMFWLVMSLGNGAAWRMI